MTVTEKRLLGPVRPEVVLEEHGRARLFGEFDLGLLAALNQRPVRTRRHVGM